VILWDLCLCVCCCCNMCVLLLQHVCVADRKVGRETQKIDGLSCVLNDCHDRSTAAASGWCCCDHLPSPSPLPSPSRLALLCTELLRVELMCQFSSLSLALMACCIGSVMSGTDGGICTVSWKMDRHVRLSE
jgi:hypothetical protein